VKDKHWECEGKDLLSKGISQLFSAQKAVTGSGPDPF